MLMTALLSLLLGFSLAPVPASADGGKTAAIYCPSPHYYVGTTDAEPSFQVDRVFRIANRGASPVPIASAQATCACSKQSQLAYDIQYDPEIPAKSETGLRIGYKTAPVAGAPDIREFLVRFGNDQEPALSLEILAKRLDGLTVFPGHDIILRRETGKTAAKTLYLVARDRKDFRAELADQPAKGLSIRMISGEKPDDLRLPASVWENGGVVALQIEAHPSLGTANAQVRLKTNQPGFEEIVLRLAIF